MDPLPSIRQKLSFNLLITTLKSLESSRDNSGTNTPTSNTSSQPVDEATVKQFAMSVISSGLEWLSSDEQDVVYDLASKRVAERCGRSAMPTMTRTWTIPLPQSQFHPQSPTYGPIEITLHLREPALTGDILGHKTWGTSFVLAKKLEEIGHQYFSGILYPNPTSLKAVKVLELGSGTGLVGLSAAAIWSDSGVEVTLTDLPSVLENLSFNIEANLPYLNLPNPSLYPQCQELNWYNPTSTSFPDEKFNIILAADPLYDDEHPKILAETIDFYSRKETKVLIAVPFRDSITEGLSKELDRRLRESGWEEDGNGCEVVEDGDWGFGGENRNGEDEEAEEEGGKGVRMLWSVWRRKGGLT